MACSYLFYRLSVLLCYMKVNIAQLFVPVLKNAFTAFDHEKKGVLGTEMIGIIIELLGHSLQPSELDNIIREVDADGECVNFINRA